MVEDQDGGDDRHKHHGNPLVLVGNRNRVVVLVERVQTRTRALVGPDIAVVVLVVDVLVVAAPVAVVLVVAALDPVHEVQH